MAVLVPSARQHLQIGTRVFTDLTNIIYLMGGVTTASRWATLRTPNGTAGYQVTSGKTLYIRSIMMMLNAAGVTGLTQILYGDTDVGFDASAAPTNPIYMAAGSTVVISAAMAAQGSGATSSFTHNSPAINFSVPSQKYPCIKSNTAESSAHAYGYEI